MKRLFLLMLIAGSTGTAFPQVQPGLLVSGCPDSKSVVVMNYMTNSLIWLDIQKETGKETVMADNKYIIGIAKNKKDDDYILYYMFLGEGGIGNKNMAL